MRYQIVIKSGDDEIHVTSTSLDSERKTEYSFGLSMTILLVGLLGFVVMAAIIYGYATHDYSILKEIASSGAKLFYAAANAVITSK